MIVKNLVIERPNKKPIVWDAFFNATNKPKPIVIFCHGYKGFKDWGCWNLVAQEFMNSDFFFLKFNFSHNGGTVKNPIDFPDLEAFAENNYSKELEDLNDVIVFLTSKENEFISEIDTNTISLIGHSRGGGICIIKAAEDLRIKQLITWASVCNFENRTATIGDLEQWKREGVKYVENSRTKQMMPHNYQFYKDFITNQKRLNIKNACKQLDIPYLIIHGEDDPSVVFEEALLLHKWNPQSKLYSVKAANHVFNAKHPWLEGNLPNALQKVVNRSIKFINKKRPSIS